jgi:protease-4
MSEGQREVLNALLDDFFNRYKETVARDRKKSVEDVAALIDNAPVSAKDAESAGLIDGALYREQVEEKLKERVGGYKEDEKLRAVSMSEYKRVTPESLGLNEGERIALIYASGAIGSGKTDDGSFGGDQMVGSDTVVKALNDARDDKGVKAIVIRVDSPGGSIYPSDLIWNAVESAKRKKPVVISMGDVAASGGYYVSMGAHRIVAQPSTITGSIGVFAGKPVVRGLYDWLGVSNEYVLRGKNAGMFRETEKFTEDEWKKFTGMIDSFYWNDFLPKVAEGRKYPNVEAVHQLAQGRVWTGAQAKERGLVDEFGGLDRAGTSGGEGAGQHPGRQGRAPRRFPAADLLSSNSSAAASDDASARRDGGATARAGVINALPRDAQRALRFARMFDRCSAARRCDAALRAGDQVRGRWR